MAGHTADPGIPSKCMQVQLLTTGLPSLLHADKIRPIQQKTKTSKTPALCGLGKLLTGNLARRGQKSFRRSYAMSTAHIWKW